MCGLREGGDGLAHALVAPELVRLGDVVERAVAIVVFDVVEALRGPGCEVLDLVVERAGVAGASLIPVVGVGACGDAEGFNRCSEVFHAVGELLRI
jgi:hypothetical protein